ncbi:YycH family regulatory protein [Sporosarcina sp. YIM B06819]|uniref:YycH family regulatory protein n=1 Tax=Sporosarcina sp. YIM B06819 TaxID=3081769 RepID=UPI00298C2F23|nr:two-component system activity regulator YycH [Sporosarcina sp. YIM B06819]
MGLKYIETVKSIILLLLVTLSIVFTFAIWSYTPSYETSEDLPTVDISIAKRMSIDELIKPYKIIFNFEEGLTGTLAPTDIDYVLNGLKKWRISEFTLVDNNFTAKKLDVLMRTPNQFTLYFHGEVPLPVYNTVLNGVDPKMTVPETTFDRLIVDWNPTSKSMNISFVSRGNQLLYRAKAKVDDYPSVHRSLLTWGRNLGQYADSNPGHLPFIAVAAEPVETIRNMYYQREINPSRFRDALFSNPNAVRRSQSGLNKEEYQDDHALMSIDTEKKTLKYVVPAPESQELAVASELLFNTIDFVNEHGGWTDGFRYTSMSPKSRYVKFQLFLHGLPVYGDTNSTEMTQVWGNNRILSYARPYYTLDLPFPETDVELLPSGVEITEMLKNSEALDFSAIEELTIGYFMRHDLERRLFIMEPSWFYLTKGTWVRVSPEQLGGGIIGLE